MTVGGSCKRFMKWRILDRLCLKDQKYQQDICRLKGTGNITSCYGWCMLGLRHFYRFLDEFRGPESWGASSEAIHFHHFPVVATSAVVPAPRGAFVSAPSLAWGWDFLVAFGMPRKKARKNGRKYVFLLVHSFPPGMKAKTGQISQNEMNTNWFKLSFTLCCPGFHPSTWGWEDSQKAEEYAHLTRSASWHGQFWVVESIYFVGRFQSSEIAVTRWILRGMDAIEIHEDHHFSSTVNQSDAINEASFTNITEEYIKLKTKFRGAAQIIQGQIKVGGGSGYWGSVIHWAKSLNSSGLSMCVCHNCHNVRSIMITSYNKCTILWSIPLFFLLTSWWTSIARCHAFNDTSTHSSSQHNHLKEDISQQGLFTSALPRPGMPSPV